MTAQRQPRPLPAPATDSALWGAQITALFAPIRSGFDDIESELADIRRALECESDGITFHLQTFSTEGL